MKNNGQDEWESERTRKMQQGVESSQGPTGSWWRSFQREASQCGCMIFFSLLLLFSASSVCVQVLPWEIFLDNFFDLSFLSPSLHSILWEVSLALSFSSSTNIFLFWQSHISTRTFSFSCLFVFLKFQFILFCYFIFNERKFIVVVKSTNSNQNF